MNCTLTAQEPPDSLWCNWDTCWLCRASPEQARVHQHAYATINSEMEPAERWRQRSLSSTGMSFLCCHSSAIRISSLCWTCVSEMCFTCGTDFSSERGKVILGVHWAQIWWKYFPSFKISLPERVSRLKVWQNFTKNKVLNLLLLYIPKPVLTRSLFPFFCMLLKWDKNRGTCVQCSWQISWWISEKKIA